MGWGGVSGRHGGGARGLLALVLWSWVWVLLFCRCHGRAPNSRVGLPCAALYRMCTQRWQLLPRRRLRMCWRRLKPRMTRCVGGCDCLTLWGVATAVGFYCQQVPTRLPVHVLEAAQANRC